MLRTHHSPPVTIREVRSDEVSVHATVFLGLSERSRYQRFHTGMPRLPAPMARRLAAVDGDRHVAFVAEAEEAPVGLVRYLLTELGVADLALEVIDAWQHRGVGRLLLRTAAAHAAEHGIRRLVGEIVGSNGPALALARSELPGLNGRWHRGTFAFSADLSLMADRSGRAAMAAAPMGVPSSPAPIPVCRPTEHPVRLTEPLG